MPDDTGHAPCSLIWSWRLAEASMPLAVLALLTTWPLMIIGAGLAWLLGVAALVSLVVTLTGSRVRRYGQAALSVLLTGGLVLGLTYLWLAALHAVREGSKASISQANLKGIYSAVYAYAEQTGTRPAELQDLVTARLDSPRSFISIFDPAPDASRWEPNRVVYSSYEFTPPTRLPCNDPNVVIAYEREPFTPAAIKIGAGRVRLVLFGDGRVAGLDEQPFREALRKDQQRRRELGWLTTQPARPQ